MTIKSNNQNNENIYIDNSMKQQGFSKQKLIYGLDGRWPYAQLIKYLIFLGKIRKIL